MRSARRIHVIIVALMVALWLLALCIVGATVYWLFFGGR
jgi:hypothetical protein